MKVQSHQEKRIAIAKDVVRRLRYLRIKANNTYVSNVDRVFSVDDIGKEMSPRVCKLEKNCDVCALGGMFLSHLRLFNNFTYNMYGINRTRITLDALNEYFSSDQLNLIEECFEYPPFDSKYQKQHPKTRLRMIMLNIIKNKGTFEP